MAEREGVVDRLRRPEYTGDNRCTPCTILNVAMAASGSLLVVTWGSAYASTEAGLAAGSVVFVASLAAIWLRGYLVPGTPTLTTRYLPDRVLRWFDKPTENSIGVHSGRDADGDEVDVERLLLDANALEPCRDGDYCLTEAFEDHWQTETERLEETEDWAGALADFDIVDPDASVEIDDSGSACIVRSDGRRLGTWESRVTARADAAAAVLLASRIDGWSSLTIDQRAQLAGGLRLFLEVCPNCGGPLTFETNTRRSCCVDRQVAVVSCEDCDERVFEEPVDPDAIPA